MQAMILAAGLGTRLRPWTLEHPKALVPVGGEPMLGRVMDNLRSQGFTRIVVNVHHFADQIVDFLNSRDSGCDISVSDERGMLLDTGGAIVEAQSLFDFSKGPVLVHNVDILSNADLGALMREHERTGADSTLLVSDRDSGRKLVFDEGMNLRGWHNIKENIYRPGNFVGSSDDVELAFSGIHVVGEGMIAEMRDLQYRRCFPVMEYLLDPRRKCVSKGYEQEGLNLIDIGKPDTLRMANLSIGD